MMILFEINRNCYNFYFSKSFIYNVFFGVEITTLVCGSTICVFFFGFCQQELYITEIVTSSSNKRRSRTIESQNTGMV